ncbi:MAG: hypothetical protein ABIJ00_03220 [Candidatus Eisenbacteria bacterium]
MKTISGMILILLLVFIMFGGVSCLLEDKVIEIVLTGTTCADFHEDEDSENFTTPKTVNYGEEIEDILADNDISRDDIVSAVVVGGSYTVTAFSHTHDWTCSGEITVRRDAGADATLIEYTSLSILATLGVSVTADLEPGGVAILDQALQDFLGGANPVLTFTVVSETGDVDPDPSPSDPMVFDWKACITIHVTMDEEFEGPA